MKKAGETTRIISVARRIKDRRAMTLIEVMIAAALIVVAALGSMCYEYLCIDHVRYARAELTATRVGQLLIEDWKGEGGSDDYNPEDLQMGFELPDHVLTNCVTVVDGLPLHISMTESPVPGGSDSVAGIKLSELSVVVGWRKDFGSGGLKDDDPRVALVTYVRQDQ
jgi:prepilin-type N-terminal cleavage/methylation domain-containing protein